ncbi:MAG TPA: class I tRNA ligase family protein [Kofleriaceae bacterium]|nr:class I tRNA ligase family protein [Kofleriaceae bacterium]
MSRDEDFSQGAKRSSDGEPVRYEEVSRRFETAWQARWKAAGTFVVPNPGQPGFDASRPKLVVLDFFPYPSGSGLHIGHPRGYLATDVFVRFQKMRGKNVLYSMGFDSFGLPAEQYAIQTGQHPRITTEANTANILKQLEYLGVAHDPTRRFSTTDPSYFKWTQWIFLLLFKSYYDPTHAWTDSQGREVSGRARPIEELRERLKSGAWTLDETGKPVPGGAGRTAAADEIEDALTHARLAFLSEQPVNWCPGLGTVLASEEVTSEGKSERGDFPVYKRRMRQWMLRITEYKDRLLDDLGLIDWPTGTRLMQVNWINRSLGAEVEFEGTLADGQREKIVVFTTRPDTLFGATYVVLSPEHPLTERFTTPEHRDAVVRYRAEAELGSTAERGTKREKTGVFTGGFVKHPLTGEPLPVWVADYVLMGYGSGAVMAVPAHDTRDFEFAVAHDLPIVAVVQPTEAWLAAHRPKASPAPVYVDDPAAYREAFTDDGVAIQSASGGFSIDGLATPDAIAAVIRRLSELGCGRPLTTYRLRDWLFSRQRYWGEPFPIVHDGLRPYAVEDGQLPVELPPLDDFAPTPNQAIDSPPQAPLDRAAGWTTVNGIVVDDDTVRLVDAAPGATVEHAGKRHTVRAFRRETNTMPNWAGSSWYYLRYFDPHNDRALVDPAAEVYWGTSPQQSAGSIDLYVGGAEHAVLHLLYARFWHKVLYDLSLVHTPEPFYKLVNQGMITADAYRDDREVYVDVHDVRVEKHGSERRAFHKETGERLEIVAGKMGKRYKNGVPPEEVCDEYSVDTFRLYQMYLGPIDVGLPWEDEAIIGLQRFLGHVWSLAMRAPRTPTPDDAIDKLVHRTIEIVSRDLEQLRLNTAIARLIELSNAMRKAPAVYEPHLVTLVVLLSPYAPHIAEELLQRLVPARHAELGSVIHFPWPVFDPDRARPDLCTVVVQINGKRRATVDVEREITGAQLEAAARGHEKVAPLLEGQQVRRVVTVLEPMPKLVNFVLM